MGERKTFGRNVLVDETPASEEALPDVAEIRKAANRLSVVPFKRAALVPLAAAALVPLLLAGAAQLPFGELLKASKALLIL